MKDLWLKLWLTYGEHDVSAFDLKTSKNILLPNKYIFYLWCSIIFINIIIAILSRPSGKIDIFLQTERQESM